MALLGKLRQQLLVPLFELHFRQSVTARIMIDLLIIKLFIRRVLRFVPVIFVLGLNLAHSHAPFDQNRIQGRIIGPGTNILFIYWLIGTHLIHIMN